MKTLKKVLIITYYWPPAGGPGVQRVLKFAKYLPQFGWQPIILTVNNGDYPVLDTSLSKEIPDNIPCYKTRILEPYFLYKKFVGLKTNESFDKAVLFQRNQQSAPKKIAGWIRKNIFIPDAKIGWLPFAIKKAIRLVRTQKIDAIFSTSPPYTPALVAWVTRKYTGVPWLCDFRDPWSGYLSETNVTKLSRKISSTLEKKVFENCDCFTAAWPGIIDMFHQKFPHVPLDKARWIANGFDFDITQTNHLPNIIGKFVLTYSGSFYARRYPAEFVQNLGKVLRESSFIRNHLLIQIIGRIDPTVVDQIKKHLPEENLKIIAYLPHKELLQKLFATDGLWLVMDDVPEAKYIVAGKTYEYIGLQKPILACLPTGTQSEKIIQTTNTGCRTNSNDPETIASLLTEWLNKWQQGKPIFEFNQHEIQKFHRKNLTSQLAYLLDQMLVKDTL